MILGEVWRMCVTVLYNVLIDELTMIFRSPKVGGLQILTMEYVTHLEAPSGIFDYHPTHHTPHPSA